MNIIAALQGCVLSYTHAIGPHAASLGGAQAGLAATVPETRVQAQTRRAWRRSGGVGVRARSHPPCFPPRVPDISAPTEMPQFWAPHTPSQFVRVTQSEFALKSPVAPKFLP